MNKCRKGDGLALIKGRTGDHASQETLLFSCVNDVEKLGGGMTQKTSQLSYLHKNKMSYFTLWCNTQTSPAQTLASKNIVVLADSGV